MQVFNMASLCRVIIICKNRVDTLLVRLACKSISRTFFSGSETEKSTKRSEKRGGRAGPLLLVTRFHISKSCYSRALGIGERVGGWGQMVVVSPLIYVIKLNCNKQYYETKL